jgi:DHA1 family bicyclomycin/chloramphenicol resistance-like MFS transporter
LCFKFALKIKDILTSKKKNTTLLIIGGLSALAPLSIDMYLPAFPAIASDLGTNIAMVTLSLTSYFIGISVGQLFYGPISDKYGRRKPLLFGLGLFILAAIGCALSPTINWFIFMRIILSLGGCVGMVVSRAIVRDLFPVSEIAKIFSSLMLIIGIAPIVAPTIGGWVVMISSWRTIFYILNGIALILFFMVYFFLDESKTPEMDKSLNIGVVLKQYLFVLKNKSFLFFAFLSAIASGGMFSYISGSSFVFIKYFGLTEGQFALIFSMNAFGFIIGSQLNRLLLNRSTSLQIIQKSGIALFGVVVLLSVLFWANALTMPILVSLIFLFLFLLGIFNPNCTALALTPFNQNAGSASALIGFIQMFCGALFSGLISMIHDRTLFPMILGIVLSGSTVFCIVMRLNSKIRAGEMHFAERV